MISVQDMAVFCKKKGFVYPSSEIYGGFSGFFDYGPLGVELKNNIKKEWWKSHVNQRDDIVGVDGSIITNPKVWEASGHVSSFADIAVVCKKCGSKNKIDKHELGKIKCDKCGGEYKNLGEFNTMFITQVGPIKEDSVKAYLRPETAQIMFVDFKQVAENARLKLPFGIAQIGRAFRNEISPRDFLFRCREFEQMEIEYFINPEDQKCPFIKNIINDDLLVYSAEMQDKNQEPKRIKVKELIAKKIIKSEWHAYWLAFEAKWFVNLGVNKNNLRIRQHKKDELAHYSTDCWDLEYNFPFGWKELEGIADRSNYDLTQHSKYSKQDLSLFDEESKKKILPNVIAEPSLGVDRAFLVFMFEAYNYDKSRENVVLKLHPKLVPYEIAVFPLVNRFDDGALKLHKELKKNFRSFYDRSGSIGRRYSRADEVGIPLAITVDSKEGVTIRNRNDTKQIRVKIKDLCNIIKKLIDCEMGFDKAGKMEETRKK